MDIVEFRALQVDRGNWVYGYLVIENGFFMSNGKPDHIKPVVRGYIFDGYGRSYEICVDTASQYTGKKDRNGNKIYAGDRVRFSAHYFGDSREKECVEVIEWNNGECSYNWKLTETGWADGPEWCEVIGNIHETTGDNDG